MPRSRFVAVALAVAGACGALSSGAWAAPSTPRTLTYEMTDCAGPAGTPTSLVGFKQPGGAAALHLETGGNFVFMEAIDANTGAILFSTPGFERNGIPLVTCELVAPLQDVIVSGLVTPTRARK